MIYDEVILVLPPLLEKALRIRAGLFSFMASSLLESHGGKKN